MTNNTKNTKNSKPKPNTNAKKEMENFFKKHGKEMFGFYSMASALAVDTTVEHFKQLNNVYSSFAPEIKTNIRNVVKGWLIASAEHGTLAVNITKEDADKINEKIDKTINDWWDAMDKKNSYRTEYLK